MEKPKIVSIVGLTASGKSSLGIKMAQEFNGEIISCDSRQVFTGLDIGTAKVTWEERALVPHHMLDVVTPTAHFNVADFQRQAYACIEDILARGKLPILVGGSGLYSRSIVEGYYFEAEGFEQKSEGNIRHGKTKSHKNSPRYDVLQICLLPSKEFIVPLIERRIEERLGAGMIEETRQLLEQGASADFLRSLGLEYFWNTELIEGRVTVDEYKKQLATKTTQFAKRQRTWFKKEKNTIFLEEPLKFYEETRKLIKKFI